ncbi:hypothetical protein [uncultured Methanobrevibacter sp.]|uniref:hypothetical protein n=1 Tax=uncultured Methanobrevibacter sp. TaxID=253161 RepID=UPI003418B8F2
MAIAVIYVGFSMNELDNSMSEISDNIAAGDKEYNEAVDLINNKNYDGALEKVFYASDNFNKSLENLSIIQNNSDNLSDIHNDYINTIIDEVELKRNAASNLISAIYYLRNNDNTTGSSYGSEANSLMDEAMVHQNTRNRLIEDNPNLFR